MTSYEIIQLANQKLSAGGVRVRLHPHRVDPTDGKIILDNRIEELTRQVETLREVSKFLEQYKRGY